MELEDIHCYIWYTFQEMTPTFGMFFRNAFVAQLCRKSEGFFQELEGFFREAEGFFQRVLGSKDSAASLTDLPELH